MRFNRGAVVCGAVLLGVSGLTPLTAASADEPVPDLYVTSGGACQAAGPGTQASPYCTVQEAADAVEPGQTVHVGPGTYLGTVTLTRSGAPDAPISFVGTSGNQTDFQTFLDNSSGQTPTVTLSNVHDVRISKFLISNGSSADGVDVVGSSRVGFSESRIARGGPSSPADTSASFHVDGASSAVSITRNYTLRSPGYSVRVDPGAHDVTVATNELADDKSGAVRASGATGLAVTGNTVVAAACAVAVVLDGGTAATVENNDLRSELQTEPQPCATIPLVSVASDSAATVHSDYNGLRVTAPRFAYSWAGTDYAGGPDLAAAVPGQAAHDNDYVITSGSGTVSPGRAALADSADANAPGATAVDYSGGTRVADDPDVPNTGTGAGVMDRGAIEERSRVTVHPAFSPADATCAAPCLLTADVTTSDSWGEPVTTEVDFGDGSAPQPVSEGSAAHLYTRSGSYTATTTATDADGVQARSVQQVRVASTQAPTPALSAKHVVDLSTGGFMFGVADFTYSAGDDGWEIASWSYDWGDGTSSEPSAEKTTSTGHRYTAPGTYTATLTTTDVLGRTSHATVTVTVGDGILPHAPVRVYDTRSSGGGHHPIAAHGTLTLSRSQFANMWNHSIHGVYLTTTVTGASAGGYLSVYPSGTARPASSVLNFSAGQNVPNTVPARFGSDGKVVFYNGSDKSIDLVVDQSAVEAGSMDDGDMPADTYTPVGPTRILDTRNGTGARKGAVPANSELAFTAAGVGGVPADAAAVLLNIAGTDTKASGHLTAYGHGSAYPGTSNSNWAAGQTVSNLVLVPLTDGEVVLRNSSAGSTDFVADVVGYYHHYGTASVIVPTPLTRVLDTRTGAGTGGTIAEIPARGTVRLQLAGTDGLPVTGVTAAELNLTVPRQTHGGYVTAYPDGTARPTASTVNFTAGRTTANAAVTPVGADGAIDLYNGSDAPINLVADLSGYYYAYPDIQN